MEILAKLKTNKFGIMAKFLIFRTDRIGDFITSQVVTNSISEISIKNKGLSNQEAQTLIFD